MTLSRLYLKHQMMIDGECALNGVDQMALPIPRLFNLIFVWMQREYLPQGVGEEKHQENLNNFKMQFRKPLFRMKLVKFNPKFPKM